MLALGCLIPVLLGLGGLLLGAWIGGGDWVIWGGVAGLVLGTAVPVVMIAALARSKGRR
ncbi:MAG: hypothetical protein RLN87_01935 [Parasphingopyxis sp.]